jgi:hypothetical protein
MTMGSGIGQSRDGCKFFGPWKDGSGRFLKKAA